MTTILIMVMMMMLMMMMMMMLMMMMMMMIYKYRCAWIVQKEFDIEVTDENEAPTDIVTTPLAPVPENVTVPHILTSLTVIDEDAEQRHSCHLAGPQGPLSVDTREDGSMTLVVQGRLDYETAPRYDVVLSCSDGMYDVTKVGFL